MLDASNSPAQPAYGEHEGRLSPRSVAQLAEELVRAGSRGAVDWEGARLATHFQPLYDVRRARCLGYEALMRATDSRGNSIRPDAFIAATEVGSRVLLDWTCRAMHLRNYAIVDPGDRTLFLNVHPEAAVKDAKCAREFADLIRYYGLVPKRVCVEILESGCTDEGLLREAVAAYRALGVSIAMDDFGIARSNFDRIVRLRPDVVKIDRSLLAEAVLGESRAKRMLAAMVELLHEANARVAIEGIETALEARVALDANADYLQGFHFCTPQAGLPDEQVGAARLAELVSKGAGKRRAVA
jgi:EAL domain-containing protein (putative c-di-GMP-specific phosphodiesterase class I)